jgi:hypothetical protein
MSETECNENIQFITTELCMILGEDSIDNISKEDAIRELCKIIDYKIEKKAF